MIDTSDLEFAIVGGLMLDDTHSAYAMENLQIQHFTLLTPIKIFKAMRSLSLEDIPLDPVLVLSEIRKEYDQTMFSSELIYQILGEATNPEHVPHYIDQLIHIRKIEDRRITRLEAIRND